MENVKAHLALKDNIYICLEIAEHVILDAELAQDLLIQIVLRVMFQKYYKMVSVLL